MLKKFLKRLLKAIGILLLLLIVLIITIPLIFKKQINEKVKSEINEQLNAKVDYGDFSISLLSSFPNFSFSLNDLSVVGIDSFKGDTLAYVKNFNFTIDLMSVIKGDKYKLLAINITDPDVNAEVNYDGKANWDIVKSKGAASSGEPAAKESSNFSLEIKKYKITNANISYDDKKGNMFADIKDFNFEGSGDVTSDVYDFKTITKIAELTFKSGSVAYLSKAKLGADINIAVDTKNNKYTFKENDISLNNLKLQFDGYAATPPSGTNLDVTFKSKETEFKSILSLIPAVYKKDFDKIKTSGSLALSGKVKGTYKGDNYPSFNLNLKVDNGMFQYPDLPVPVKNIYIATEVSKPQGGLDLTVIDISKLHMEAAGDPIDAVIGVKTPISDPDVKAYISGKLDLANVPKFYPVEGMKNLSGLFLAKVNFKGKKSDVDKKNYKAIDASGTVKVSGLVYDSKDIPMPVKITDLELTFNPQDVALNNLTAILGKSDLRADGRLENFMAYFFGKGDLAGVLNLRSNVFDANEWLQKDKNAPAPAAKTAAKVDTAKTQFFKVPAHIDFTANSQFGKVFYDKMVLENVKGQVTIKDEAINLNNLVAALLGGTARISAKYDTKHTDHPNVSFAYVISNFDIQQTYKTIGMAEKMAPIIKYVQGSYSSDLKGTGKLNPDMSVDYNSLDGDGKIQLPDVKVIDPPVLAEVTKVAKIPALQNLEIKNGWTVIKFKNGRVSVDPTDLKFGNGYNMNVQGSNGFDQSIDYDMRLDVPTKELGAATSAVQGLLSQVPGLNAAMPDILSFYLKVTGTAAKPIVKLTKMLPGSSSGKSAGNAAADELKKKADELKKQAEQQAKALADKAKQDAQSEADRLKKEAQDKAKGLFGNFPH
ncbi:MAG: hypothetical protein JWO06_636 [Bacteroidota bacterium]|nr:hypothetical protein [Bacteroidota bacterium]